MVGLAINFVVDLMIDIIVNLQYCSIPSRSNVDSAINNDSTYKFQFVQRRISDSISEVNFERLTKVRYTLKR